MPAIAGLSGNRRRITGTLACLRRPKHAPIKSLIGGQKPPVLSFSRAVNCNDHHVQSCAPAADPILAAADQVSKGLADCLAPRDTVTQHRPPVGSVASPKQLAPVRDSPFGPACTARNKWDPIGSRRPGHLHLVGDALIEATRGFGLEQLRRAIFMLARATSD
jgi:hypothetical protein